MTADKQMVDIHMGSQLTHRLWVTGSVFSCDGNRITLWHNSTGKHFYSYILIPDTVPLTRSHIRGDFYFIVTAKLGIWAKQSKHP